MTDSLQTLIYQEDQFDGIIIEGFSALSSADAKSILENLGIFAEQNKRIIWVTRTLPGASYLIIHSQFFHFHNCSDNNITLTRSLVENNEIAHPHHWRRRIGKAVGYSGDQRDHKSLNGFNPGGHLELKESIEEAAQREVIEETGIKAKFLSINGLLSKFPYRFEPISISFARWKPSQPTFISTDQKKLPKPNG